MKEMRKILLIVMLFLVLFALSGCGKTVVDLNKYIKFSVEGYNSVGTVSYEFDYQAFKKDYADKIKPNADNLYDEMVFSNVIAGNMTEDAFLRECVHQRLDRTSMLSNGDKVTLEWKCEDEIAEETYNVKLKYSDIIYTVNGLEEVDAINPFDYITVEFSGISSEGVLDIIVNLDEKKDPIMFYTVDKNKGLKNGDKVTVKTKIIGTIESFVEQYGVTLSSTEQTYTVEGLQSYVSSSKDITNEALVKMKKQAEDELISYIAKHWGEKEELRALNYIGNYYLNRKEGMYGDANCIYMVYKVDVTYDGTPDSYYYFVRYENLLKDDNGNCYVDTSIYGTPVDKYITGKGYFYYGYGSLEELYKNCILVNLDSYTFEDNVNN